MLGVSEPVIFQNFGSKTALYAAVLDRVASRLRDDLHALTQQHGPASSLLARILSPPPGGGPHGPAPHRVLFADAATLAADPELAEPAVRAARALAGHLADLVRRGQADGDIRADADPEAAAWLLLSLLSARSLREGAMTDAGRVEPGVTALALQALAPPGGAAALPGPVGSS
jgi:AcrR family transcriptional regulator